MNIKNFKNKKEIEKVADLFVQIFIESPFYEKWTHEEAIKILSKSYENAKEYCVYAEENNKILGFIFCLIKPWNQGDLLHIYQTGVHPEYRSKKVGNQMFRFISEKARKKGIRRVELTTCKQSKAFDFWEKQGFKETGLVKMKKIME